MAKFGVDNEEEKALLLWDQDSQSYVRIIVTLKFGQPRPISLKRRVCSRGGAFTVVSIID